MKNTVVRILGVCIRAHRFTAFIAVLLASSFATGDTGSRAIADAIKSLEQTPPDFLYDMHGNASKQLRFLMIARFSATTAITDEIDRLEGKRANPELVKALYKSLSFVKDPESIKWLQTKLAGEVLSNVYASWLHGWKNSIDGYGRWQWLEGKSQWIQFFIDMYTKETGSSRRTDLLEVLSGFEDSVVVEFFKRQENHVLAPRETLVVASYLSRRGVLPNVEKIRSAVSSLALLPENRQFLVETAYAFRNEAFVPFLISILDIPTKPYSRESLWNPQKALQEITFETAVTGKAGWELWYRKHSEQDRTIWASQAIEKMRSVLHKSEKAALAIFDKRIYVWHDMLFLPFIRDELTTRAVFFSKIAGWINLTYEPVYRTQLTAIALKITQNPKLLERWARELMIERDFLPGRKQHSWEEEVYFDNSHV